MAKHENDETAVLQTINLSQKILNRKKRNAIDLELDFNRNRNGIGVVTIVKRNGIGQERDRQNRIFHEFIYRNSRCY